MSDLVHGNLRPGNILLDGDRLTAVIGTEATGNGSRLHDLATITACALLEDGDLGALEDLLGYATRHARPGEWEISFAACLLTLLATHVTDDAEDAGLLLHRVTESLRQLDRPQGLPEFQR
jgi:aminoglycoside phosphotransferase (APT) family kinase protein